MIKKEKEASAESVPAEAEQIVGKVRERYARFAEGTTCGSVAAAPCCGSAEAEVAGKIGYDEDELASLPDGANLGLGCGAPLASLDLQPGETVLDLGSGGGLDAFLAAKRVGAQGKVIGVDMTPEMISRAQHNASQAGYTQVEFREGRLEALPVDDASVDAVTSNCVINLVPDKARVFREIARVLKPGGRVAISDIVLDGPLPATLETDLLAYVGCIAGAMRREKYFGMVEAAGLTNVEIAKDVDYLAAVGDVLPDEIQELMRRTHVRIEDVRGLVRSVTFAARKPRSGLSES